MRDTDHRRATHARNAALVVRDEPTRNRLAGYLQSAGIDVVAYEHTPPLLIAPAIAVWVIAYDDDPASSLALLRSWLGSRSLRRAIIVTRTASTVRTALREDDDRVHILTPPIFPWQLVDAVRSTHAVRR